MATLLSILLILGLKFVFGPPPLELFSIAALTTGAVFLVITPLIRGFILGSMQSSSVEGSARALSLARKDKKLYLLSFVWISFILFSFTCALFQLSSLYWVWLIGLGIALDSIMLYTMRAQRYIDPYGLLEVFSKESIGLFGTKNQKELTYSIDGIAEVGIKGLFQRSIGLTSKSMHSLELVGRRYLKESNQEQDSANFTLLYILQRLDMLFTQALDDGLETVATSAVVSVSKLTLAAAERDSSLALMPIHFLQKFIRLSLERDEREVAENTSISLFEVSKNLLHEHKSNKKGLGMVLLKLISSMEEVAQETFKEDKNTPIQLLTHPFRELKELLETPELESFSEKEQVKEDLVRVLAEFQALEAVLQSVPNIPGYEKLATQKT